MIACGSGLWIVGRDGRDVLLPKVLFRGDGHVAEVEPDVVIWFAGGEVE